MFFYRMFSLVKFDNGEYSVLLTKRIKIIQNKNCVVRYIGEAKYRANLLDTSGIIHYKLIVINYF